MPNIDAPSTNSFCWFELATTDQIGAKQFYQSLFGWEVEDQPIGPAEVYTLFRIRGRDVAAASTMREDQRRQGVPPNWLVYIAVESADRAAEQAAFHEASIVAPPFDVIDQGRMAVIQGPSGAMFAVWQAKQHSGIGVSGEPHTVCWADLATPDQAGAAHFYTDLFGWKMVEGKSMAPAKPGTYFHIVNGDQFIGGIPPSEHHQPQTPSHWLIYFEVRSCDASIDQARTLGATVHMEPTTIGETGRMAVLANPQGAVFALFEPGNGAR